MICLMSEPTPTDTSSFLRRLAEQSADASAAAASGPRLAACLHGLPQYGLIRAAGPDAASFLQGQLTNDVTQVSATRAQLSAWCTPQGRVLATLVLWRAADGFLLLVPTDLAAPLAQRMSRYILRARVELAPVAGLVLLGLSGEDVRGALMQLHLQASPGALDVLPVEGGSAVLLREDLAFLALTQEAALAAWQGLSARLTLRDAQHWDLQRIRAGMPMITRATQDAFVPQMLNLERLEAVSFSKGCYPGQEIVARAQYRGEVKRRLHHATLPSGVTASAGDAIVTAAGSGTVVEAFADAHGGELLAVLPVAARDAGPIRLSTADGPVLTVVD